MKKLALVILSLFTLSLGQSFAQPGKWTVGLVSSHFTNNNSSHQFTNIDNPFGSGLLVGYRVNDEVALSLTGEYASGDMKNAAGTENLFRTNLSAFVFPFKMDRINPYLSAGAVLNVRNKDYDHSDNSTVTQLQSRFGGGVDFALIGGLSLNADFAVYTAEIRYVGWAQSIGLRLAL